MRTELHRAYFALLCLSSDKHPTAILISYRTIWSEVPDMDKN